MYKVTHTQTVSHANGYWLWLYTRPLLPPSRACEVVATAASGGHRGSRSRELVHERGVPHTPRPRDRRAAPPILERRVGARGQQTIDDEAVAVAGREVQRRHPQTVAPVHIDAGHCEQQVECAELGVHARNVQVGRRLVVPHHRKVEDGITRPRLQLGEQELVLHLLAKHYP